MNAALREWVSENAVQLAATLGMNVAVASDGIIIDQYKLAVENACAGMSSTLSLVAICLLFAYWVRGASPKTALGLAAIAIPIALTTNVLRVVLLLLLVSHFGSSILDTLVHPLSGLISFGVAAILLWSSAAFFGYLLRSRKGASSLHAANS